MTGLHSTEPLLPPALERACDDALATAFRAASVDPLFDSHVFAISAAASRLVQRHGVLIQAAIAKALERGGLEVTTNVRFPITEAVDALIDSAPDGRLDSIHMPLGGASVRFVDVDIFAVCENKRLAFATSVKRGFGCSNGRTRKAADRDLRAVALLGRAYARSHGYRTEIIETAHIDFYGAAQFPAGTAVTRGGLDDFFGVPVTATVDAVTAYLKRGADERFSALMAEPQMPDGEKHDLSLLFTTTDTFASRARQ